MILTASLVFVILLTGSNPSKLAVLSIPSIIIILIILVAMVADNTIVTVDRDIYNSNQFPNYVNITTSYVIWSGTMLYIGNLMYLFSNITCLHTIRNTMVKKKDCGYAIIMTYICMGIGFLVIACSFYSAYGNEVEYDNVFDIYKRTQKTFFDVMNCIYVLIFIAYCPLIVIAISEQIEFCDWYQKWVKKEGGEDNLYKILLTRCICCLVFIAPSLLSNDTKDIKHIIEKTGNVAVPWASFLIPVFIKQNKAFFVDKVREGFYMEMHDFLIFCIGFGMSVCGFYFDY